ncbi:MAG: hypothetical protein GY953_08715, partial [bacterium]|nr:hypothetical protein [bacterium]
TSPAIGLDIGTSRIVVARHTDGEYSFQSQLNAFVNVPYSPMTEKALKKEKVPYSKLDSTLLVHGSKSEELADMLDLETRRPMSNGLLNPNEAEGSEVIRQIVEMVIGKKDGFGQLLFYSVPAEPIGAEDNVTYHEAALREVLAGKGYQAKSIPEGLAVVYSELEESNFTGIGISCGGGLCNVCLSYLAVPVISFSVPKAGDYIDRNAAAATGDRATRIRIEKESGFHFNGNFTDKVRQALNVYYGDMIDSVISGMNQAFTESRSLPKFKHPIPLVLAGGTALPKGFAHRFEETIQQSNFPITLSEVRIAKDPLHSTAKGALVAALTEL